MKNPIVLLTGDDPTLINEALRSLIEKALDGQDRSLALEELNETAYLVENEYSAARLVDAAQTPPFLTERRVVVGRHGGRFSTKDLVAPIVEYLADPLHTTRLILVWEKGENPTHQKLSAPPKSLKEAIEVAGGAIQHCSVGRGREADQWLQKRFDAADLRFDRSARNAITQRIGEQRTRVVALFATLEAVFGTEKELSASDVEPYLGQAGGVAPWDLTVAIGAGDVAKSLDRLHRMQESGDRHPLAIVSALHAHYGRLLRLDGSGITTENGASEALGIKGFPAKKALQVSRRLGPGGAGKAIKLLAVADLDLKGRTAWPPELVTEVLVARLASLARR